MIPFSRSKGRKRRNIERQHINAVTDLDFVLIGAAMRKQIQLFSVGRKLKFQTALSIIFEINALNTRTFFIQIDFFKLTAILNFPGDDRFRTRSQ